MANETKYVFSMFEKYQDVVNVNDLCLMLGGISRKLAYKMLVNGEIRSIKIGREYKIPKVKVIEFLLQQNSRDTLENNTEL